MEYKNWKKLTISTLIASGYLSGYRITEKYNEEVCLITGEKYYPLSLNCCKDYFITNLAIKKFNRIYGYFIPKSQCYTLHDNSWKIEITFEKTGIKPFILYFVVHRDNDESAIIYNNDYIEYYKDGILYKK